MERQTVTKNSMMSRALVFLLVCSVGLVEPLLSFAAKKTSANDHMPAAQHMQRASRQIYLTKQSLGLVNEKDDFNRTGLVGEEYTPLTTTNGYLPAKRSATNPDFAAYLTKLLLEQKALQNGHGVGNHDGVVSGIEPRVVVRTRRTQNSILAHCQFGFVKLRCEPD